MAMRVQQREVTVLRRSDDCKWTPVQTAKVAMHFNIATGTDPDHPEDLALVGIVKKEAIDDFLLVSEGFPKIEVLHLRCQVD